MCNMRDYVKWDIYEKAIEDHIKEKKRVTNTNKFIRNRNKSIRIYIR